MPRLRLLVCISVLFAFATSCGDDEPTARQPTAQAAPALLPTEGPPTNVVLEPVREPIPPPGFDPALVTPRAIAPDEHAAIDEANRLGAARARETRSIDITPPAVRR